MIHIGEPVMCNRTAATSMLREALKDLEALPDGIVALLFREEAGGMQYDDGAAPDNAWAEAVDAVTFQVDDLHAAIVHDAADATTHLHYTLGVRIEEVSAIVVTKAGCAFFPDAMPLLHWRSCKRDGAREVDHYVPNCFPIHLPDTTGHDAIALLQTLNDIFKPNTHQQAARFHATARHTAHRRPAICRPQVP